MPVSALVLTLSADPHRREDALQRLRGDARLMLMPRRGPNLPVVLESETLGEGEAIVRDELPEIPGVAFVHVVSVDFSDVEWGAERRATSLGNGEGQSEPAACAGGSR